MMFSDKECKLIIEYAQRGSMRHITKFASDLTKSETDYNYGGVTKTLETEWVFKRLLDFIKLEHPTATLDKLDVFNVHEFKVGSKFVKHIDVKREKDFYYIVGTTLSSDFTGGRLLAYEPEEELAAQQGKLYGMYATRLHEVTEVLTGVRWSLVMFLTRDKLNIPKRIF